MQITAAVLRSTDGPYSIESVELDAPGPDEVLVRVVSVGMCHTDLLPRLPGGIWVPPLITGHEGAGVVEVVGDEVTGVAVGDHVVLTFDSCGTCRACREGRPCYCEGFLLRNMFGRRMDGSTGVRTAAGEEIASRWFGQSSFATHCLATARNVVVVDPALPLEHLGPLGCGILTGAGSILVGLDVQPGERLVVHGVGAVGLAAVMAAVVAGAETIVAVDLHPSRLALASSFGATHTIDGSNGDVAGQVLGLTGGGADVAFDTTGDAAVITGALGSLRLGGRLGLVGVQTADLVFDPVALVGKTVTGILEGGGDPHVLIPRLIALWQEGRFPFDRLIETFPLDQIDAAEEASLSGSVVKPVLLP